MSDESIVVIARKMPGYVTYWVEGNLFSADPQKAQVFEDEQHAAEVLYDAGWEMPACDIVTLEGRILTKEPFDRAWFALRDAQQKCLTELEDQREANLRLQSKLARMQDQLEAANETLRLYESQETGLKAEVRRMKAELEQIQVQTDPLEPSQFYASIGRGKDQD